MKTFDFTEHYVRLSPQIFQQALFLKHCFLAINLETLFQEEFLMLFSLSYYITLFTSFLYAYTRTAHKTARIYGIPK